ncbi:nitric oxide dioxygenase [Salinivibrio kushneri]|uniref:NO-inducible flavohemoprotein n=1 Tax=Salinivibrio kushneri TaxID=1908198 RepID=UPI000988BBCE|nr:NO-inducible flavohemoprotein [Salinivibrio kushneri]OOE33536.1 nitric oxide dioxygenase [Salinivibrio kushneri]
MLSQQTIDIVKSTAPVLAETGPKLTIHFYQRLFHHHPELKDIFNLRHQQNGDQREALFNAICAYAQNIDNLPALLGAVEKIAHKHTSLLVQAEHYPIVGQHLLATIDELLSPGQAVLDAWAEAYQVLADVFIAKEQQLYEDSHAQIGGWQGQRAFTLIEKRPESEQVISFVFAPQDGEPVAPFTAGQYIGIVVNHTGFEHQEIRQYSLSHAPNGQHYQISVKREPQGQVSNYLHDELAVGGTVMLTPPAGDLKLNVDPHTPVVLISGGVGVTPMLAMLESLTEHDAPVTWLHATENSKLHAFNHPVRTLARQHAHIQTHIWYNQPQPTDTLGQDFDHTGWMDLTAVSNTFSPATVQVYLCGPVGFMRHIQAQLRELGVPDEQFHYECFGPHKAL